MMGIALYIIIGVVVALMVLLVWRRQRQLKLRAHLMQEAIRNRDFTFRLPTDGLLPGERAMQQALNLLGETIRQQMNRQEVESWERLTRVLTHEIMNAMAPIASISQTLLARDEVKDTVVGEGIHAIHNTSSRLMTFVDSYRRLSQLETPHLAPFDLAPLVDEMAVLYPQLVLRADLTASEPLVGDKVMMQQVLANLMKNAVEAGAKTVVIRLEGRVVYVGNDGSPIPATDQSSVFLPFFTTKREGTGVGLALSRRMMVMQGGMLELAERQQPGCHVTFVLTLSEGPQNT